jgi:quercetin dioxygenase-like cupin family protein
MPIVRGSEAPEFSLPGAVVVGLAARSRGSAENTTYRVRLDPRSSMPPHRHDHEEVFTLLVTRRRSWMQQRSPRSRVTRS